jgi:hypothetical protein
VAQVIDETSAILSFGGRHYATAVTLLNGNIVIGAPFEILYNLNSSTAPPCTGQAWYRRSNIVSGANYLSQGSPYLVDTRPDGVYLTQFATTNGTSGLPYYSFQSYVNGTLTCTDGRSMPGFPRTADAIEIEQASGPATNVGGAGPYTVR